MFRSAVAVEISPKVAAVIVCDTGLLNTGVFARLNASPRSSNHLCSVTLNCLPSDRLNIAAPGPRSVPGPALPNVNAAGWAYAPTIPDPAGPGVASSQWFPGPTRCELFDLPTT